jgi:hypothetical protein
MNKEDLEYELQPFTGDIFLCVRLKTSDGSYIELPLAGVEYVPMSGEAPAYIALRTQS